VLRVYKEYSEICLISDPSFYATVSVAQVLGLLKGTAAGEAKIFYLEPTTVVNKGDKVSVQLPNSSYELEVGMVKEVGYDRNSLFLDVDVLPLAGPQRSKFIFIVKTASKKPR
jgi:cell shape-determining protein MreC